MEGNRSRNTPRLRSTPRPQKPPKSLKARAVALLARREYSRAELRDKLLARDEASAADATAVDVVLDEMVALGYLSDARFAKVIVARKSGDYSKRAIGAALKARGVPGDAAAAALAGSEIDDDAALIALWRRRFGRPPAGDKDKLRQVRYLQARGFSLSAIFKLLRNPPGDDDAVR